MTKKFKTRYLVATAMLSAIATILMYLEFPVAFVIPNFIKFDFSDLPALLASFSMGPISGVLVCLIKNVIHLLVSQSVGVGELANFLMGASFVFVSGLVYSKNKTKKGAFIGALLGALASAIVSLPLNYFIVYPMYVELYGMPLEAIIKAYQVFIPSVDTLFKALLIFNVPFTFCKCLISLFISMLIYKPLSPIIHGKNK